MTANESEALLDISRRPLPSTERIPTVRQAIIVLLVLGGILPARAADTEMQLVAEGLILDLNADKGVEVEDGDRVVKWTNQVTSFPARHFLKRDEGRKDPGSGRPTLRKSVAAIGGHDTLVFRRQELVNHDEDAFDHLLTGSGHTWIAVISVYKQVVQLKDVHSFFGNLKNGGMYEGIWGNVTDDNRVWIGSRNGITFGRWDGNNPMVLAAKPLEESRYYVVAGGWERGPAKSQSNFSSTRHSRWRASGSRSMRQPIRRSLRLVRNGMPPTIRAGNRSMASWPGS